MRFETDSYSGLDKNYVQISGTVFDSLSHRLGEGVTARNASKFTTFWHYRKMDGDFSLTCREKCSEDRIVCRAVVILKVTTI
jgi:hypothetical protein